MTRYAQGTSVSSQASRQEIERILERYGADQFMYGWQDQSAIVAFRMHDRRIRFVLPLPDKSDRYNHGVDDFDLGLPIGQPCTKARISAI